MGLFLDNLARTRARNQKVFAAQGVSVAEKGFASRIVREGKGAAIFTVGYEKRDGEELMTLLRLHGVQALADVRERPMSRKPDFRATALRRLCVENGIEYQSWPMLGSTTELRDELQSSGDFNRFASQFRKLAGRTMKGDLERLAQSVQHIHTALLCYEREHCECHRSLIAELIADEIDGKIIAI